MTSAGGVWQTGGSDSTANVCLPTPAPTTAPTTPPPTISLVPSPLPTTHAPSVSQLPTTYEDCWTLNMVDSWGDGWNNAYWTWFDMDGDGGVLATGTLASGSSESTEICVYPNRGSCYGMNVTAGDFPYEISWTVSKDDHDWASGGAGTRVSMCSPTSAPTPLPTPLCPAGQVRL